MALPTLYLGMFPDQLVRYTGVVEIVTIAVHPVVAGEAISTEVQAVGLNESRLKLGMTGAAA